MDIQNIQNVLRYCVTIYRQMHLLALNAVSAANIQAPVNEHFHLRMLYVITINCKVKVYQVFGWRVSTRRRHRARQGT